MENYNLDEVRTCYNITAAAYSEKFCNELDGKPFDRDILNRFAKQIEKTERAIEFGTGSGHIANYLFERGLANIVGTDISDRAIEIARNRFPKVSYEVRNMLESKYENASIGGVICFYGIVHFTYKEIKAALIEWYRIMKKDAVALFSFHIGNDESVRIEKLFDHDNASATWNLFDVEKVVNVMNEIGIKYDEVIIRYPYLDKEHPSKRCYISFSK